MAAVLRLIALVSSLCLAAVLAANVRCGRNTHKHVWIQPDDQFIFNTQRRGKPFYEDNTRCSVRYTPWGNCSEVGFTCDKMSVRAEGGSRCRGDYVALKLPGQKMDKYCSGMKPNVTSTGFMRVVFRSNKDKRVQGGARCLVECSTNWRKRSSPPKPRSKALQKTMGLRRRMNNCNGHIFAVLNRSEPVAPG